MSAFNPDLKKVFSSLEIDEQEGYAFCLLFHYGLHQFLLERNLVDPEKSLLLLELNEDKYELKYPLFTTESGGDFDTLINLIKNRNVLRSNGHVNNAQDYNVISINKETKDAFNQAAKQIENFDINQAVEVITEYYEKTKPAMKLSNYLEKGFLLDYDTF